MSASKKHRRGIVEIRYIAIIVFVLVVIGIFLVLLQTAADNPGEIQVSDVDPGNVSVHENGSVTISATVENTGEAVESQIIQFGPEFDHERTAVTLDPGEKTTVERTIDASSLAIGMNPYEVRTEDEVVTAFITVESDRPPNLELSNLRPGNFNIDSNEPVEVAVTIENTGGGIANQTLEFIANDSVWGSSQMELAPGESDELRIPNVDLLSLDPGFQTYGFSTANDSVSAIVSVPVAPTLELPEFDAPDQTVRVGNDFTFPATINNTGELTANQSVELRIDDTVYDSKNVVLEPDQERTLQFGRVSTAELGVGTYEYSLSTGDERVEGQLVIEGSEPAQYEITEFEPGDVHIDVGGSFNLTVEVENTGQQLGNETLTLVIEGEERLSTTIELGPGETEVWRIYNLHVAPRDIGEYRYGFVTPSDREIAFLRIGIR